MSSYIVCMELGRYNVDDTYRIVLLIVQVKMRYLFIFLLKTMLKMLLSLVNNITYHVFQLYLNAIHLTGTYIVEGSLKILKGANYSANLTNKSSDDYKALAQKIEVEVCIIMLIG